MMTVLVTLAAAIAPAAAQTMAPSSSSASRQPARVGPPPPAPAGTSVFLGGVPAGTATSEVITIPVLDAISRALQHNLGVLTAQQGVDRAGGARWRALSDLLPNVDGYVRETRQTLNLAAFGFGSGPGSPFADLPSIVGPFNVFDARVTVSQAVVDLSARNNVRSAEHSNEAARHTFTGARNLVIHVAGNLYIQALAAAARADAARAQQQTARALHTQALDLRQGGIIAGIDVLRAEVQLNTETQRATAAANEFEKVKLQLARVIGLPLGQPYALDPNVPELPVPDQTLQQAVDFAYRTRPEYQAALERVKAAEAARQAVASDRLPSVRVNADFGEIGLTARDARSTFSVSGAVNVPIFQGRRIEGQLLQADADLRDRRAEAEDLKASIYYEVRAAFFDLDTARQQLDVATKTRDLAAQQLTQSRDRFAAGVASNVEVIQAQEAVALANEQYINAKFGYDLAKGALIRGTGASEAMLRQLLGGGSR
jgi:outer membrane protein TolC